MTRQCFTMFHRRVDVDVDAGALVMKLLCFCLIAVISISSTLGLSPAIPQHHFLFFSCCEASN